MDILNKKKVGGGGGQTDYVFHFHFALCLNKHFLTALFSKPTFSQLLSGTTERESITQDVQGLLDFAHSFYSAISGLATQATGRVARSKDWRDWLASQQISTGRVPSDPHTTPGGTSILPSFSDRSQFCHRNWSAAFHWATTTQKLGRWLWTTA